MNSVYPISDSRLHTFLEVVISNSALAALLGLAILCTGRFLINRPGLRHALWLLVLLKLVTPPLWRIPIFYEARPSVTEEIARPAPDLQRTDAPGFETPDTVPDETPREPDKVQTQPEAAPEPDLPEDELSPPVTVLMPLEPLPTQDILTPEPAIETPAQSRTIPAPVAIAFPAVRTIGTALILLWAAGSALWVLLTSWRITHFLRALRHAAPAPPQITDRVTSLAAELGLRKIPSVRLVDGTISPCVWALLFRPVLILPVPLWNRLDPTQQDALLLHELAHLRRHDPLVRLLELVATALHWWNPVLWWARNGLHEAEEQCCDAWVMQTRPASASAYATALVETLDFLSGSRAGTVTTRTVPVGASGLGKLHHISRRITMIMKSRPNPKISWLGGLVVLALGILVLPTWAIRASSQKPIAQLPESMETVIKQTDANGDTHTIVYNAAGRLVSGQPSNGQDRLTVTTQDRTTGEVQTRQFATQESLELARSAVQVLQAKLKKTKLLAEAKHKKHERLAKAYAADTSSVPEDTLEQADADAASATADVEIAEAELNQAELKLTHLQRSLAAPATPRTAAMNANPVTVTMQGPDGKRQQIIADISPTLPQSPDLPAGASNRGTPITVTVQGPEGQPQQVIAGTMAPLPQSPDLPAGPSNRLRSVDVMVQGPEGQPQQVQTTVGFTPVAQPGADLKTHASNSLRQLMLALHNYESAYGKFPPLASRTKDGKPGLSWRVLILPFLDQQNDLYQQFHLDEPWDSEHNRKLVSKMPDVFRSHGDPETGSSPDQQTRYVAVTGPGTMWDKPEGVRIAEITDGTSNTIALIESPFVIGWTAPDGPTLTAEEHGQNPITAETIKNGILVATADGAVHNLHPRNYEVWKALCTRNGGEVISQEDRGTPVQTTQADPGDAAGGMVMMGRMIDARDVQAELARAQAAAEEARAKAAAMANARGTIAGRLFGGSEAAQAELARAQAAADEAQARAVEVLRRVGGADLRALNLDKYITEEFKQKLKSEFDAIQAEKDDMVRKLRAEQESLRDKWNNQFKTAARQFQAEREELRMKFEAERDALRKENEALKQKLEELIKK